jgi:Protein of unknown function (DUF3617)
MSIRETPVVVPMWCRTRSQPARFRAFRKSGAAPLIAWLAACCLMPRAAAADGIEPGEWKLTETIVMNGNKAPAQTRTRCLSPEQAGDTAATFSPEYRTVNSGCERVEFNSSATALRWRMQCTGQLDMDVSGDFTFDTSKHYTATIVSKGAMGGREFVNTTVSIEGEHIGDCR